MSSNYTLEVRDAMGHTNIELECRICLQKISSGYKLSSSYILQNDPGHKITLQLHQVMVRTCLVTIDSSTEDRMPTSLCVDCRDGVISAYKLRLTAKKSDIILKDRLKDCASASEFEEERQEFVEDILDPESDEGSVSAGLHYEHNYTQHQHQSEESLPAPNTEDLFSCEIRGKEFSEHANLTSQHAVDIPNPGQPFNSPVHSYSLIEEDTTLLLTDPAECQQCGGKFEETATLEAHLTACPKSAMKCEQCGETYFHLQKLIRHVKLKHNDLDRHKCNFCGLKFPTGFVLANHLLDHKGVKPYLCTICRKSFRQHCTLKDHMRTHSSTTPFLCSDCGQGFNNNSNLRQHMLRHSGEKPFACEHCPSRFVSRNGLKSHQTRHTGERPYACDVCGNTFTKNYSLVKHKRSHTGEKPFVCEVCPMAFTTSNHRARHMRIHTGEKPYKCKFCYRAFAQSNDLVKHTRTHVGECTYQCDQCPEAFKLHSELRSHIEEHFRRTKELEGN